MVSVAVALASAVLPGTAARSMVSVEPLQTTVEQDASLVRVKELHLKPYSLQLSM